MLQENGNNAVGQSGTGGGVRTVGFQLLEKPTGSIDGLNSRRKEGDTQAFGILLVS